MTTKPVRVESVTVERPKHPLYAMTTFELRDYRRQLESAIAFFGMSAQTDLRAALDAVLAEQDERERLARA